MRIALEHPARPEVMALIGELDAYQSSLYPAESNHFIDVQALAQPGVLFAVGRDAQGRALACGAVMVQEGWGELKRMFVRGQARGQGFGAALLAYLETQAHARGCRQLMLETGIRQPEALRLYERHGYRLRGPFGAYAEDPLSVFMQKDLTGGPGAAQ